MRTQMLFALALISSAAMAQAQNRKPDKVVNIICNETSVGQFIDADGHAQKIEKAISGTTAVRKIYFQKDGSKAYTLEGKVFSNGALQSTYQSHGTIQVKKISADVRQEIKESVSNQQNVDPNFKFLSSGQSSLSRNLEVVQTIETKADGSDVVTQATVNGEVQPTDTNFAFTSIDGVKYVVEMTDQPYEQTLKDGSKYKLLSSKSVCTETTAK